MNRSEHILFITPNRDEIQEFRDCNLFHIPADGETDVRGHFEKAIAVVMHETGMENTAIRNLNDEAESENDAIRARNDLRESENEEIQERNAQLGPDATPEPLIPLEPLIPALPEKQPVIEIYGNKRGYHFVRPQNTTTILSIPAVLTIRAAVTKRDDCPQPSKHEVRLQMDARLVTGLSGGTFCRFFYVAERSSAAVTLSNLVLDGTYHPGDGEHPSESSSVGHFQQVTLIFHGNEARFDPEGRLKPVSPLHVSNCTFLHCAGDGMHVFNTKTSTTVLNCRSKGCYRGAISTGGEAVNDVLVIQGFQTKPLLIKNSAGVVHPTDSLNHEPNIHMPLNLWSHSFSVLTVSDSRFSVIGGELRHNVIATLSNVRTHKFKGMPPTFRSITIHCGAGDTAPRPHLVLENCHSEHGTELQAAANTRVVGGRHKYFAFSTPTRWRRTIEDMVVALKSVKIFGSVSVPIDAPNAPKFSITTTPFHTTGEGYNPATLVVDRCKFKNPIRLHSKNVFLKNLRKFAEFEQQRLEMTLGSELVDIVPTGANVLEVKEVLTDRNDLFEESHSAPAKHW